MIIPSHCEFGFLREPSRDHTSPQGPKDLPRACALLGVCLEIAPSYHLGWSLGLSMDNDSLVVLLKQREPGNSASTSGFCQEVAPTRAKEIGFGLATKFALLRLT